MKFLICVDLEGCACVVGKPGKGLSECEGYAFACKEAVSEANAAISALFDAGAEEVVVWDGHGSSSNLSYQDLDPRCQIITGLGYAHRLFFVDNTYSGALFIGYHSRDNVRNAVLCHSYSSARYQWIKVNGKEMGELEIDAAICGEANVPVIFASSDDVGCRQMTEAAPWVRTVSTKKSLGHNLALSKHPVQVKKEIYQTVYDAASHLAEMKCYHISQPATIQVRYTRIEDAQFRHGYREIDREEDAADAYSKTFVVDRISYFF